LTAKAGSRRPSTSIDRPYLLAMDGGVALGRAATALTGKGQQQ
jgi:hypothetical protein